MITNNIIFGGINFNYGLNAEIVIINNTITDSTIGVDFTSNSNFCSVTAEILNNTISNADYGVVIPEAQSVFIVISKHVNANISGNKISKCSIAGIAIGGSSVRPGESGLPNNVTIINNHLTENYYGLKAQDGSPVENNTVVNNQYGLACYGPIKNNIIANNYNGISGGTLIEKNLIVNNYIGINRTTVIGGGLIFNNTIAKNEYAIEGDLTELIHNNIINNVENIQRTPASTTDANATYNWWGTIDTDIIDQSIYDYYDDFSLGRVVYTPFLNEFNTDAPVIPTFTIVASSGDGGSISPSGDILVSYGDNQTFNVSPNEGYQISNVLIDGVPVEMPYTIYTVISDGHIIHATFELSPVPTASPSPSPTATPTPTPIQSPTPSPSPTPTPTVEPTPSPTPESTPSLTPTPTDNQEDSGNFFFSPTFLIVIGVVVVISVVIGGVLIWKKW